jgi:hypothetical protein
MFKMMKTDTKLVALRYYDHVTKNICFWCFSIVTWFLNFSVGSTPKTPTKKEKTPKKVKTPLIMVPTNTSFGKDIKQISTGRSTRHSQTHRNEENLPHDNVAKRNLSASSVVEKNLAQFEEPCNEMKRQLDQQMNKISKFGGNLPSNLCGMNTIYVG